MPPPDPHEALAGVPSLSPAQATVDSDVASNECAICYEPLDDHGSGGERSVELPCSHRFCSTCVKKLREVASARYTPSKQPPHTHLRRTNSHKMPHRFCYN